MKGKKIVIQVLLPLSVLVFAVSPVFGFGIPTPMDPSLVNQSLTYYQLYDGQTPIADVMNLQTGANSTSSLTYNNGGYSFTGTASPYSLHGMVSANNPTSSADLNVGTAFRDQLYFTTENGKPAEIVFNFNVNIAISDSTSNNFFYYPSLFMAVYDGQTNIWEDGTVHPRPYAYAWSYLFYETFSGSVAVSTLGTGSNDPDYATGPWELVDSGTYFPFLIGMNADVINGSVDWLNSLTLDSVSVYQYDGTNRTQLLPGQYTITSLSDNFPSTPVPEPATMLLLGSGLIGLAG